MRNWNFLTPALYSFNLFWFWLYLWGIETILGTFAPLLAEWFWLYLWGIETAQLLRLVLRHLQFWLYLWGIETRVKYLFLMQMVIYFDSTYEELKLPDDAMCRLITNTFWLYLWGIETYIRVVVEPVSNSNFDSTYEELKHRFWE